MPNRRRMIIAFPVVTSEPVRPNEGCTQTLQRHFAARCVRRRYPSIDKTGACLGCSTIHYDHGDVRCADVGRAAAVLRSVVTVCDMRCPGTTAMSPVTDSARGEVCRACDSRLINFVHDTSGEIKRRCSRSIVGNVSMLGPSNHNDRLSIAPCMVMESLSISLKLSKERIP
jgi:hypothetical protein